jgi:hypothetical protein
MLTAPQSSWTEPDGYPDSPFLIENEAAYRQWRNEKLAGYPTSPADLLVEVEDPRCLTADEHAAILRLCRKANMAIYRSRLGSLEDKEIAQRLGLAFGLRDLDHNPLADEDGVTSLSYVPEKSGRGYIPYSKRRLLWHTDGYYNPPARRIRAFVLHCVHPAGEGGENALLDHEIAYIRVRDADPAYVQALMHPEAMTIPPNVEGGTETRAAQSGPVFSIDPLNGRLHMRYTARTRSIVWRDDAVTREAVRCLEQVLAEESPYVFRYRLGPGEGLVCNNVVHNRTAFSDTPAAAARLLYRARYYNRLAET